MMRSPKGLGDDIVGNSKIPRLKFTEFRIPELKFPKLEFLKENSQNLEFPKQLEFLENNFTFLNNFSLHSHNQKG